MTSPATAICPGCHFRCQLSDYQCGRGAKFYETWQAGGEIPEHRMPPLREGIPDDGAKPDKGDDRKPSRGEGAVDGVALAQSNTPAAPKAGNVPNGKPGKHVPPAHFAKLPVGSRLMLLMNLANNVIRDRNDEVRDRRIAECIMRQGGSATNRIIAERTHLDDAAIDEQIAILEEAGLATSRALEDGRMFHDLTEAGDAQAKRWLEEHRASDAEFYSALTDEEADQLEALLAKALEPHMRRGPKR